VIATGGSGGNRYKWSRSSDTLAKAINLASGLHTVTVEDKNGCLANLSETLTQPNEISITEKIINNKCYGDSSASIELKVSSATPPYTYKWSNDSSRNVVTNLKDGDYKVTIKDANGCESKRTYPVVDPDKLILDSIESIPNGCSEKASGQLTIYASGGVRDFLYSIDSGNRFSRDSNFQNLKAGTYNIMVRDKNGCILRGIDSVKGFAILNLTIDPSDTSIMLGEKVKVRYEVNEGNVNWIKEIIWSPSNGLSCSDCLDPEINIYTSQEYKLRIRYFSDCYLERTIKIRVVSNDEFYVPNSFSPNAIESNENKTFKVYGKNIAEARLSIYNRWGEKVYHTTDAHLEGWDGRFKGEPQSSGVYIYSLEIQFLDRRKLVKMGEVNLIR
jgi:gliding motility-associated-like protein